MNGYLLDTQTLLWAFEGDRRLRRQAARLFEDSSTRIFVSIVSYWELQIKQNVGKLRVAPTFNERFCQWLDGGGIEWLPIRRPHCDGYRALPLHHRDPFDRMLVAQAQVEDLAILTSDRRFKRYDVNVVWSNWLARSQIATKRGSSIRRNLPLA
jgi:PIN domain nuclease of toxin-antitoxin system